MADIETTPIESGMDQDYLAQIQELRKNTVSREQYEKMRDENKKLLEAIVNGSQVGTQEEERPAMRPLEEICKDLLDGNNSNLDYWKYSIEWRDACRATCGFDPWAVNGIKIEAEPEDPEIIERVYEGFKEMIEFADGDSAKFDREYDRHVRDVNYRPRR